MTSYILKDPLYDKSVSKTHNFSVQWTKYFPEVKSAEHGIKVEEDDVLIINLDKGNPYGTLKVPDNSKKLFIVHTIDSSTVDFINDADFVIYMNKLQKEIVEDIVGIERPSLTCPRHPMFDFTTEVNQKDLVYMGGWFTENYVKGLFERIKKLHKDLPQELEFGFFPVWGKINKYKILIEEFRNELKGYAFEFDRRNVFINNSELFYDVMVHKTRISKYAYLWDNGPTIEEIKDLISAKDLKILDYPVKESSMLATIQSSPKEEIVVEDRIKFLPFFEKTEKFTYQQFSLLIRHGIDTLLN